MSRNLALVVLLGCSIGVAADLSEKFAKRIESAESTYQQAVAKADNVRFYAVQKANSDRVKALKQALTDATKAGDFDAATAIKERISEAEKTGPREKPKNTVKFGGHEYALIEDGAAWPLAKSRCEQMGGHLAIINNADEMNFVRQLCGQQTVWLGGSDAEAEGNWRWVDGARVTLKMEVDNLYDCDHWMALYQGAFHDGAAGHRYAYLCEFPSLK